VHSAKSGIRGNNSTRPSSACVRSTSVTAEWLVPADRRRGGLGARPARPEARGHSSQLENTFQPSVKTAPSYAPSHQT
jgi:hypothetical protein